MRTSVNKLLVTVALFIANLVVSNVYCQTLKGEVRDARTNETLIGATVGIKGTALGTTTDINGQFSLETQKRDTIVLMVSYMGFVKREVTVRDVSVFQLITLKQEEKSLKEVSITDTRLTSKQRESPLTVEAMDIIAIRETPSANFYDGLGALKGVDVTAASLGFKVVNTRGFNSTSPVRSLQLIDGVDNQSPGLNFSLGNFLGTSELDLLKVDIIAGASSAFYGPNAFNGVISMTTRSPFVKPGLEVSYKTGSRELSEMAMRYAVVLKNKEGEEKLGMKFNAFYLKAYDWEANNLAATPQSRNGVDNPGGYDAVNIYGDEYFSAGDYGRLSLVKSFPGLGTLYRTGYAEKDLVDYNTRNVKLNTAIHYKFNKETELIASSNFGYGTTVYQGDNRYSLKDILFFQNRLELTKRDKYFIRAYFTNENAGNSYDAYFTALLLQRAVKSDEDWQNDYWRSWVSNRFHTKIMQFPGYPKPADYTDYNSFLQAITPFLLENYYDSLTLYHSISLAYANSPGNPLNSNQAFLIPGTYEFDTTFKSITSRETFAGGGSRFYDKSALGHIHGEYVFKAIGFNFTTGANFRQYLPNSRGTIFSDTSGVQIRNSEFGIYGGVERILFDERLKLNGTLRVDKNRNFGYLFSPALSCIYSPDKLNTVRFSFSSAIRNPTLADQYLYYQVGRAILIGNLNGFDSLVTIPSLITGLNNNNIDSLDFFNVNPVTPEKVKTFEVGYRTTFFDRLFIDANAYLSIYKDFIGYKIGADVNLAPNLPLQIIPQKIYRVATNSNDIVNTYGASIGASYFFNRFYSLYGNWSWNVLDRQGSDDPLIPAYNTPEHKFNVGVTGSNIENSLGKDWGFALNYKWVQGFLFEGSPQFTGEIDNYDLVDVQFNKRFPEAKSTIKLGCSNLLNNLHYEVYGGPEIGRLFYMQLLVELN